MTSGCTTLLGACAACLLLSACGDTPEPASRAPSSHAVPTAGDAFRPTHRVVRAEPYYRDGPQQARPPDGALTIGDEVERVRDEGSYVQVRFRDGKQASVSVSSLEAIK